MITRIPAYLYRGGTSKGPLILAQHLPAAREVLDRVMLAAMGSPHKRQVDGIGGAETLNHQNPNLDDRIIRFRRSDEPVNAAFLRGHGFADVRGSGLPLRYRKV